MLRTSTSRTCTLCHIGGCEVMISVCQNGQRHGSAIAIRRPSSAGRCGAISTNIHVHCTRTTCNAHARRSCDRHAAADICYVVACRTTQTRMLCHTHQKHAWTVDAATALRGGTNCRTRRDRTQRSAPQSRRHRMRHQPPPPHALPSSLLLCMRLLVRWAD